MSYLIGVTGGTASGKTSTCHIIKDQLHNKVTIISLDSFYISVHNNEENINFDHPDRFDWSLLISTLKQLKHNQPVEIPIYNFITHQRDGFITVVPEKCIILEGILVLYNQEGTLPFYPLAPKPGQLPRLLSLL